MITMNVVYALIAWPAGVVADTFPDQLRRTAFGLFNLARGVALFMASIIAGSLWSTFRPAATFSAGTGFAAIAFIGMLLYRPKPTGPRPVE